MSANSFVDTSRNPKNKMVTTLDGGGLGSAVSGTMSVNQRRRVDWHVRDMKRSFQTSWSGV